jgi:hypothetical protein
MKLLTIKIPPYVNETRFYLFRATLHARPPLQMRRIFKIWHFYISIMVNSDDEDFGRERIDDDGLDDAGRRLCGLVTWRRDTDQLTTLAFACAGRCPLRGRMVAVPGA